MGTTLRRNLLFKIELPRRPNGRDHTLESNFNLSWPQSEAQVVSSVTQWWRERGLDS